MESVVGGDEVVEHDQDENADDDSNNSDNDQVVEMRRWLRIFPEEIWLLVLDKLRDPDTLLKCTMASPYLKLLLEPKRTLYLFPQVLKVLDQQKFLSSDDTWQLLRCRLVCSNWQYSVNRLFEFRPYNCKFSSTKKTRYFHCARAIRRDIAFPAWFRLYEFDINKLENEILAKINIPLYQRNSPSPSRHLEIDEQNFHSQDAVNNPIMLERYRSATEEFLVKVGHHFWHARINLQLRLTTLEWYTLLRKYVQLMPNLKSLFIKHSQSRHFCYSQWTDEVVITVCELPFPTLHNLEFISLERAPRSSVRTILKANKKVGAIEIRDCFYENKNVERVPGQILDSLSPHSFSISVKSQIEFVGIPSSWRLQVLKIDFDDCVEDIPWSSIFWKLENYQDTLTELNIMLPKSIDFHGVLNNSRTSQSSLNLPKLKRLEINLQKQQCTIDFLLSLQSLEYLHLESWNRILSSGVIKFDKHIADNFMKCNIWELIPSIKEVSMSIDSEGSDLVRRFRRLKT